MKKVKTGETVGLIRNLDDLGRITIPKEFRRQLKMPINGSFEMFLLKDGLFLKKVQE